MIEVRVINNELKTETSHTFFLPRQVQKLADAVGVKKVLRITCQITNIFHKPTTQIIELQ